ncbi:MAG: NADH-quinone oxidoreductase subunit NuoE, partial [Deltaproteobacteria bacterium]|nr:NADH-quinone oxidoreductase subunit NuoE [Deltaproteobacteria bacterium]
MLSKDTKAEISTLLTRYSSKESVLIPALYLAQQENSSYLSHEDIGEVAEILGITKSKAFGVATYYTMFNTKPVGKYHLQVDTNIPATLMGAGEIMAHLEKRLDIKAGETTSDGMFTLSSVEDLGSCGTCPVIQVNDTYYENMTIERVDELLKSLKIGALPERKDESYFGSKCGILLKNRGKKNSTEIGTYKESGGYEALKKARTMKPDDILAIVKEALLRGRGGAGFPAGMKWSFLPKSDPRPVYLICNADEGEPGTFKDRQIMEYDPHLLIESIAIASYAIGCRTAFVYIRGEFKWISDILIKAVEEARQEGMLGDLDIIIHRGAGSYVCGEETALIESLEGKRGNPRKKPPFPANVGLYGCPTIVNNVETLSCLPYIIENGVEEFKKIGEAGNFGPKLFGVSGHVNRPGVYEYPIATLLPEILEAAGGISGNLKAVIVGGLSVPIMKADEISNLKMDYDGCLNAGTMLGSGGIMVMNDTVSIPKIALRTIKF